MDNLLLDNEFFSALPEHLRTSLLKQSHRKSYSEGEVIFQRGDPGDRLIIVDDGIIEISLMSMTGRKSVLNLLNKGDLLGEIAVFDGLPRSADAYAKTDVKTVEISRVAVKSYFSESTEALWQIIEVLCSRVRNASTMFETRTANFATTRIARCLLKVASLWGEKTDAGTEIKQNLTQSDLGDLSGLARENVYRHLKHLIQDDIVHYEQGRFTILDMAKLTDLAEQE